MLAKAPLAVIPAITPDRYTPHVLHERTRDWPETNCYIDVWIEILHALGEDPRAALGFTVAQDFEGDHFTFMKFPLDELYALFGLEAQELALYDTLEGHIIEQTTRGRMVVVEVDAFHLPDTRGISYGLEHTKTTIAVNRIDAARHELHYFHGPGFYALTGDDYDAMMRHGADGLFPYAEFVKLDRRKSCDPGAAFEILRRHLARRPAHNPVALFREHLGDQAAAVATRPNAFLHRYAFNTARQLGMNFELLGSHLAWLSAGRRTSFEASIESCKALSAGAKTFQFQLARAIARKRFDGIETLVDPLIDHYARIFEHLVGA